MVTDQQRRTLHTRAELTAFGWTRAKIRDLFRGNRERAGFRKTMGAHDGYSWAAGALEAGLGDSLIWPRNVLRGT